MVPVRLSNATELLTRDGWLLFLTRFMRLFAYGSLSLILVFYLTGLGLSETQTGTLFTFTLLGDTVISLFLTTRADRIGQLTRLGGGPAATYHFGCGPAQHLA